MMAWLVSRLQRHIAGAMTVALAIFFCWLLARWTWVFVTPRELPAPVASPAVFDAIEPILGAHLFGAQAKDGTKAQPLTALQLKLRGVFATGRPQAASAVINSGAKDDAYRVGDAVLPGVVLEAVASDHVLLRRQGVLEQLNLEEKAKAAELLTVSPGRSRGAQP